MKTDIHENHTETIIERNNEQLSELKDMYDKGSIDADEFGRYSNDIRHGKFEDVNQMKDYISTHSSDMKDSPSMESSNPAYSADPLAPNADDHYHADTETVQIDENTTYSRTEMSGTSGDVREHRQNLRDELTEMRKNGEIGADEYGKRINDINHGGYDDYASVKDAMEKESVSSVGNTPAQDSPAMEGPSPEPHIEGAKVETIDLGNGTTISKASGTVHGGPEITPERQEKLDILDEQFRNGEISSSRYNLEKKKLNTRWRAEDVRNASQENMSSTLETPSSESLDTHSSTLTEQPISEPSSIHDVSARIEGDTISVTETNVNGIAGKGGTLDVSSFQVDLQKGTLIRTGGHFEGVEGTMNASNVEKLPDSMLNPDGTVDFQKFMESDILSADEKNYIQKAYENDGVYRNQEVALNTEQAVTAPEMTSPGRNFRPMSVQVETINGMSGEIRIAPDGSASIAGDSIKGAPGLTQSEHLAAFTAEPSVQEAILKAQASDTFVRPKFDSVELVKNFTIDTPEGPQKVFMTMDMDGNADIYFKDRTFNNPQAYRYAEAHALKTPDAQAVKAHLDECRNVLGSEFEQVKGKISNLEGLNQTQGDVFNHLSSDAFTQIDDGHRVSRAMRVPDVMDANDELLHMPDNDLTNSLNELCQQQPEMTNMLADLMNNPNMKVLLVFAALASAVVAYMAIRNAIQQQNEKAIAEKTAARESEIEHIYGKNDAHEKGDSLSASIQDENRGEGNSSETKETSTQAMEKKESDSIEKNSSSDNSMTQDGERTQETVKESSEMEEMEPAGRKTQAIDDFMKENGNGWKEAVEKGTAVEIRQPKDIEAVYNPLTNTEYLAQPGDGNVVVKGSQGEEWVMTLEEAEKTYSFDKTALERDGSATGRSADSPSEYISLRVPNGIQLALPDGQTVNDAAHEHGDGDVLICRRGKDGQPDLSSLKAVNGKLFDEAYSMGPTIEVKTQDRSVEEPEKSEDKGPDKTDGNMKESPSSSEKKEADVKEDQTKDEEIHGKENPADEAVKEQSDEKDKGDDGKDQSSPSLDTGETMERNASESKEAAVEKGSSIAASVETQEKTALSERGHMTWMVDKESGSLIVGGGITSKGLLHVYEEAQKYAEANGLNISNLVIGKDTKAIASDVFRSIEENSSKFSRIKPENLLFEAEKNAYKFIEAAKGLRIPETFKNLYFDGYAPDACLSITDRDGKRGFRNFHAVIFRNVKKVPDLFMAYSHIDIIAQKDTIPGHSMEVGKQSFGTSVKPYGDMIKVRDNGEKEFPSDEMTRKQKLEQNLEPVKKVLNNSGHGWLVSEAQSQKELDSLGKAINRDTVSELKSLQETRKELETALSDVMRNAKNSPNYVLNEYSKTEEFQARKEEIRKELGGVMGTAYGGDTHTNTLQEEFSKLQKLSNALAKDKSKEGKELKAQLDEYLNGGFDNYIENKKDIRAQILNEKIDRYCDARARLEFMETETFKSRMETWDDFTKLDEYNKITNAISEIDKQIETLSKEGGELFSSQEKATIKEAKNHNETALGIRASSFGESAFENVAVRLIANKDMIELADRLNEMAKEQTDPVVKKAYEDASKDVLRGKILVALNGMEINAYAFANCNLEGCIADNNNHINLEKIIMAQEKAINDLKEQRSNLKEGEDPTRLDKMIKEKEAALESTINALAGAKSSARAVLASNSLASNKNFGTVMGIAESMVPAIARNSGTDKAHKGIVTNLNGKSVSNIRLPNLKDEKKKYERSVAKEDRKLTVMTVASGVVGKMFDPEYKVPEALKDIALTPLLILASLHDLFKKFVLDNRVTDISGEKKFNFYDNAAKYYGSVHSLDVSKVTDKNQLKALAIDRNTMASIIALDSTLPNATMTSIVKQLRPVLDKEGNVVDSAIDSKDAQKIKDMLINSRFNVNELASLGEQLRNSSLSIDGKVSLIKETLSKAADDFMHARSTPSDKNKKRLILSDEIRDEADEKQNRLIQKAENHINTLTDGNNGSSSKEKSDSSSKREATGTNRARKSNLSKNNKSEKGLEK